MDCNCKDRAKIYPWDQQQLGFSDYEEVLYSIYCKLYEEVPLFYNNERIRMKYYPPEYNKLSGLRHIIYGNFDKTGKDIDRLPDLRRCERVAWGRYTIDNTTDKLCDKILVYDELNRGEIDTVIYSECLDYYVVLSRRKGYYLLKTAFPITYSRKRDEIYRKHREFTQRNKRN